MTKTQRIDVSELRKGHIVHAHGGTFEVLEDARASGSHFPRDEKNVYGFGPTCCAVSEAVCLTGEIPGYFRPGSDWTFQGAKGLVFVHVEV